MSTRPSPRSGRPRPRTTRRAGARSTWCREKIPKNGRSPAADAPRPCRARRDSSRPDFCYLTRSPNNMPVRIVRLCLSEISNLVGAPGRIRTSDPQTRSLMDHRTPRSRSPTHMALVHCQHADTRSKARAKSTECHRVCDRWSNEVGLTNSAAVQDRRDERQVVSTPVHARILDIRWTHSAIWI